MNAAPYPPVPADLASLRNIILKTGRTQIVEYGVGHSTRVFAEALAEVDANHRDCHSVDASPHYILEAEKLIPEWARSFVTFHKRKVDRVLFQGQMVCEYNWTPPTVPDFIYLDAPEPSQLSSGYWPASKTYPPIACDILRYEAHLFPLCIIVVDGRALNARFLFKNLQRSWSYRYCVERDQHFFVLTEGTLGLAKHEQFAKDTYYPNGKWDINDL
jgi:hypothetical protein